MQLRRFKFVTGFMKTDAALMALVDTVDFYRLFNGQWFDEADNVLDEAVLIRQLEYVLENEYHWRAPLSVNALFDFSAYRAVALGRFSKPPQKSSREKFLEKLDDARKHAEAAFDSTHDSMTGLLNSKGFRETARILIASCENSTLNTTAPATTEMSPASVAMFAMDIDHFKQVNDTYGHMYGDVVLQCLAKRLQALGTKIEDATAKHVSTAIARPSGEEFLIFLAGHLNDGQIREQAEMIRQSIADQPMPTDDEWNLLASTEAKKTPLPHPSYRRLTISLGATITASPKISRVDAIIDSMRNQADRALYTAKSGGRNACRFYSEILLKYGQVLEHHQETDLVAIDLGKLVDVTLGQEFHVYHPLFSGDKDFVRTDGRSTKVLGKYPRKIVGTIEVIDVQQEISFCRVNERSRPGTFIVGSNLESIAMGSITHLISTDSFAGIVPGSNLSTAEAFKTSLDSVKSPHAVAVFSLDALTEVAQQRGTAFVNAALAELYSSIKTTFPATLAISQIQNTDFAVLWLTTKVADLERALEVIRRASDKCSHLTTFSAGVFSSSVKQPALNSDKSELKQSNALEYARFAVSDAKRKGNEISHFSPTTAINLMHASRSKQLKAQVIEDYKIFRALGIKNSTVENLASITAFDYDKDDEAFILECAGNGVELNPNDPILLGNYGIYFVYFGRPLLGFPHLSRAFDIQPTLDFKVYGPVYAASMFAHYENGGAVVMAELNRVIDEALKISLPSYGVTSQMLLSMKAKVASLA